MFKANKEERYEKRFMNGLLHFMDKIKTKLDSNFKLLSIMEPKKESAFCELI